jgi:protein-S-isoprenylcysteine O-methyltransferase Ste14
MLASNWMVVITVSVSVVLHFGVVLREKHYLEGKFGEAYRESRARVLHYGRF